MCGIYGFTGSEDKKLLTQMMAVIKHCGPDALGTYIKKVFPSATSA